MADFGTDGTDTKSVIGSPYPENGVEAEWSDLEPILGPKELKERFLFGIPLVSRIKDPRTGQAEAMTDEQLKTYIEGALRKAEAEAHIDISPVRRKEKHPFDMNHYRSFGYFVTKHKPATRLLDFTVAPSNGSTIFRMPMQWIETANMARGQINVIPMTAAWIPGGYLSTDPAGATMFLLLMGNRSWLPAFWQIDYISGFPDTMVPRYINDLIGTIAAMEILSMLAATYAQVQSHSLSIDGLGQSVSTPGPQVFKPRIDDLKEERVKIAKKLKKKFGQALFSGTL